MRISENMKKVMILCIFLILVLAVMISGLQLLESAVFYPGATTPTPSRTITREGVDYYPRQDIAVMLLMGVDDSAGGSAAAEMIMLLVFDETTEQCRILALDRDTVMEIPMPGAGANQAGQLGLAHTYGVGPSGGCKNTKAAVSEFLYGIRIDGYVCAGIEALGILNDLVDGVRVTVTDDFSPVDPTINMGELTLSGQQAVCYLTAADDSLNLSRTARQMDYMQGLMAALRAKSNQSHGFALSVAEKLLPHIDTNCSLSMLTDLIGDYFDYDVAEIVSPQGEMVMGEEKYEFHVDEAQLDELILRLFYAPKE